MWIRTQRRQKIVNSEHIIDIFVDKTGTKVYADTNEDADFILLGEYNNRDDSLIVLEHLFHYMCDKKAAGIEMPFAGSPNQWATRYSSSQ